MRGGQSGTPTERQQQVIQRAACPRRAEKPIMEPDRRPVALISSDGGFVQGEFLLWEESPDDADRVRLAVTFGDEEIARDADDFFAALCSIRAVLGVADLMPRCYGSSRNVYPSGMTRGMGTGDKAYRLYLGRARTDGGHRRHLRGRVRRGPGLGSGPGDLLSGVAREPHIG